MLDRLKSIGFVVIVLIISAGFYWLIFMDKKQKEDSLEFAMNLLGDKLLAMIPEETNKKPVEKLFEDFSKRAANREISPERIEYVAASIFNLSHNESELTPEEAEALLSYSFSAPLNNDSTTHYEEMMSSSDSNMKGMMSRPPRPPRPPKLERPVSPEKWKKVVRRIKQVHQFDREMQHALKESLREQQHLQDEIRYRIDKDLKIELDAKMRELIDEKELKQLASEMRQLEREHMLEWRENFGQEFRHEMMELKHELRQLDKLKELELLRHHPDFERLKSLESLEQLKSLEKLKHIPVVDPDSIERIVRESLKAAGLDTLQE